MEEYPTGGLFEGKNFVFDSRVSVPAVTDIGTDKDIDRKAHVEEGRVKKGSGRGSGSGRGGGSGLDDDSEAASIENNLPDDLNPTNSTNIANKNNNNNNNNDNDNISSSHDDRKNNYGICVDLGSIQDTKHTTQISSSCDKSVIGRCVDCSCPYDCFSGLIVCTVCRLPVLVCTVCAVERCYPGEYHCFRHRQDKFTEKVLLRLFIFLPSIPLFFTVSHVFFLFLFVYFFFFLPLFFLQFVSFLLSFTPNIESQTS